jgi:hypothetical protein
MNELKPGDRVEALRYPCSWHEGVYLGRAPTTATPPNIGTGRTTQLHGVVVRWLDGTEDVIWGPANAIPIRPFPEEQ